MRKLVWFLFGVGFVALLASICGFVFLRNVGGFSARAEPSAIETWLARKARGLTIPPDARRRSNPIATNPEGLAEARAHWADHSAVCHAKNRTGATQIG